jgi:site-specific DNA-methyltransferase (adenine-specific)
MGSFPYPRNGIVKLDYEFILLFKKQGIPPAPSKVQKELSIMTKDEWNTYFSGHWYFAGVKQDGHLAMYPEELPTRLIKMFSFSGETVLDPFLGSGTTSLAARNLGRNSVGYEINEDFISIIKAKLNVSQSDLAVTGYVFQQDSVKTDLNKEIEKLPYIFTDPHKLDKKIDPKKLQFGSKIDKDSGERETYYSVKEVISPELVKLDNDLVVRLIGVKEKKAANGQAIKFLLEKTKGYKVFLKFDKQKYDDGNNLLCYLYLSNKTFINAHIIKEGLVDVDNLIDFKYKDKFLKLRTQNG